MGSLTFTVRTPRGVVSWSELDALAKDTLPVDVAGGILAGDAELIADIRAVLSPTNHIDSITVLHPEVIYTMSEERDKPSDVAAAMIYVGRGRALLDTAGWEVLDAAIGEDEDDGEYDGCIIH